MELKKLIKILSVVAIAVWLFSLSFLVSQQIVKRKMEQTPTQPPIVTNTPINSGDYNQPTQPILTPGIDTNATVPSQPVWIVCFTAHVLTSV